MSLNSMAGVIIKEGNLHTRTLAQRKMLYEDGSREWNDAAVNPETPRMASSHQMLERGKKVLFSWRLHREHGSADTLIQISSLQN